MKISSETIKIYTNAIKKVIPLITFYITYLMSGIFFTSIFIYLFLFKNEKNVDQFLMLSVLTYIGWYFLYYYIVTFKTDIVNKKIHIRYLKFFKKSSDLIVVFGFFVYLFYIFLAVVMNNVFFIDVLKFLNNGLQFLFIPIILMVVIIPAFYIIAFHLPGKYTFGVIVIIFGLILQDREMDKYTFDPLIKLAGNNFVQTYLLPISIFYLYFHFFRIKYKEIVLNKNI